MVYELKKRSCEVWSNKGIENSARKCRIRQKCRIQEEEGDGGGGGGI